MYSGAFPPGPVTSLFDAHDAIIYEMGNFRNWAFFPIFFVIDDLWFYTYHRLVHAVPFLYKHVRDMFPFFFFADESLVHVASPHWLLHTQILASVSLPLVSISLLYLTGSYGAPPVQDPLCYHFARHSSSRNFTARAWRGW